MKDAELVAVLLLFTEQGARSSSQTELDQAFSDRDESWEYRNQAEDAFRFAVSIIRDIIGEQYDNTDLTNTRLRNQADFYSLFGALVELQRSGQLPSVPDARARITHFIKRVDETANHGTDSIAMKYYEAARSASSDKRPRETRIDIVRDVLLGDHDDNPAVNQS